MTSLIKTENRAFKSNNKQNTQRTVQRTTRLFEERERRRSKMRHWPVWVYYALVVVLSSLSSDITTLVTAATEEETTTTTLLSNFDDIVGSRIRQLNVRGASIAFYDAVSTYSTVKTLLRWFYICNALLLFFVTSTSSLSLPFSFLLLLLACYCCY